MPKNYSNLNEVERLALVAKGSNALEEITETLEKYEFTAIEARELLNGLVIGFDEVFQENPDKIYELIKKKTSKSQ